MSTVRRMGTGTERAVLSLVAALALALACCGAWSTDEDKTMQLPRWDFWQPLHVRPQFTGIYLSSRPGRINLPRQRFAPIDLFELEDGASVALPNRLLYGNVLLRPTVLSDASAAAENPAVRAAVAFAVDAIKRAEAVNIGTGVAVERAVILPLFVTGDNGESEMSVLHEFMTTRRTAQRFRSHVTLGFNFYLTLSDASFGRRHRVVVALDRDGVHQLFQHTHTALTSSSETSDVVGVSTSASCSAASACQVAASANPRILSFNVWNTNPSGDVYGHMRRWEQYVKRLDHLVRFVRDADADIVGFQEVRYDGVLGRRGEHAQVQHLAARLPGYQYVYQAAMSYVNDRDPYERIEEGPAIFSRHPIVATDYLLLSRDPNDPNDAHQRLCLHAVVAHPQWGLVDVYVTHLSLSERNREQTMVEIWRYMQRGRGVTQVLLGDLNAEPQSRGIRFLRGEAELEGETTDLRDAWLERHDEPPPGSTDATDRATKFTFPSDNPVKRIDFVLYRGKGRVQACDVIAQAPTDDTALFPKTVGMLNAKSPIYASDHRGVVAEFTAAT